MRLALDLLLPFPLLLSNRDMARLQLGLRLGAELFFLAQMREGMAVELWCSIIGASCLSSVPLAYRMPGKAKAGGAMFRVELRLQAADRSPPASVLSVGVPRGGAPVPRYERCPVTDCGFR